MSHATDILTAAGIAIDQRGSERDRPDGERSMATAVKTFAAMTGRNITETEGWLFMVCLKAARATGGAYREDDYTDMAAYAALAGESASGVKPAVQAGCRHTTTITSTNGMTTICASCSMPRPRIDEKARARSERISCEPDSATAILFNHANAEPIPQNVADVPCSSIDTKLRESYQKSWRLISEEMAKDQRNIVTECEHSYIYSLDRDCYVCGHCGNARPATAVRLSDAPAPTKECTHRYVQLTTGGLVCADCKTPWQK